MQRVSPSPGLYYKDCDLIYSSGSVHSRITAPGSLNSKVGSSFRSTYSFQSNLTVRSSTKEKHKISRLEVLIFFIIFIFAVISALTMMMSWY